ALQAADRDRLLLDAAAPACRLARPVAGASEDARKHVGLPIDHVGVAIATRRDQPDVFGNSGVCRTGPLAIHDLVEVVRISDVGILHFLLDHAHPATFAQGLRDALHAPSSVPSSGFDLRPNPKEDSNRPSTPILPLASDG